MSVARIEVLQGDIAQVPADAIVNAANDHLWMGAGVAGALKRAGGDEIEREAISKGPIAVGDAVATGAGRLPAKWVIHAAAMGQDLRTDAEKIRRATENALRVADEIGAHSMVLPALGTGVGGFPLDECARIMVETVREHFASGSHLEGVQTEMVFIARPSMDRRLDEVLTQIEHFDSSSQKMLAGLLEGLVLEGAEVLGPWQERVREYPEAVRRQMIERHWKAFPLWYYRAALAERDAELWRVDATVEAAFDLLAVLAALNKLYFTRFQLKRTRELVDRMKLAPPRLADRLEALVRLDPGESADELARLVTETRDLVRKELPELDLPLRFSPDARLRRWSDR